MLADNAVDFSVHYLLPVKFFGQTVYITTTHVTTLIVAGSIILLALFARHQIMKEDYEVPNDVQNVIELVVEFLSDLIHESMGRHAKPFVNYVSTVMIFIFLSNISGLFGLRPPTADYGTTLALALITFVLIQYSAIKTSKIRVLTNLTKPIPLLTPVNIIGELAVPVSLSLRLFGNMIAGTVMLALWYGMLPVLMKIGIPTFLHAYFDLFSGAIQTYVFAMLTMVYITDKRDAED
ncbi:MAG TPA: F0F1 ATP synthase subunit A [Candidatus Fimousia stercorigallinarum]|nr:F0F1 ATP synthase subunit A [Candidatus Fimousia stercorigallinarum]